MSTAYEMPTENRGISFPVRNMRGVARPMRVNLVPAPLQFRIRVSSWPRNMPWDLRGKNLHPMRLSTGVGGELGRRKLKSSYRDIFCIRFFSYAEYSLSFDLWTFERSRIIDDNDNRFDGSFYILFFFFFLINIIFFLW